MAGATEAHRKDFKHGAREQGALGFPVELEEVMEKAKPLAAKRLAELGVK